MSALPHFARHNCRMAPMADLYSSEVVASNDVVLELGTRTISNEHTDSGLAIREVIALQHRNSTIIAYLDCTRP